MNPFPNRQLVTILRRIRHDEQDQGSSPKLTAEVVLKVEGDGLTLATGTTTEKVSTSGTAHLIAGNIVPVAWKDGKPQVALAHEWRRAQGAPVVAISGAAVEELFIETDPATGQKDVFFRNASVLTPLGLSAYLTASIFSLGVMWAEDTKTFAIANFSTNIWNVFELNRQPNKVLPAGQKPMAKFVQTVDLSSAVLNGLIFDDRGHLVVQSFNPDHSTTLTDYSASGTPVIQTIPAIGGLPVYTIPDSVAFVKSQLGGSTDFPFGAVFSMASLESVIVTRMTKGQAIQWVDTGSVALQANEWVDPNGLLHVGLVNFNRFSQGFLVGNAQGQKTFPLFSGTGFLWWTSASPATPQWTPPPYSFAGGWAPSGGIFVSLTLHHAIVNSQIFKGNGKPLGNSNFLLVDIVNKTLVGPIATQTPTINAYNNGQIFLLFPDVLYYAIEPTNAALTLDKTLTDTVLTMPPIKGAAKAVTSLKALPENLKASYPTTGQQQVTVAGPGSYGEAAFLRAFQLVNDPVILGIVGLYLPA